MRHRIARTGAIALALAAFTGPASGAEEPVEALRLTRLGGTEPAAAFMYPQAETGDARRDSLDPEQLRYSIKSREIAL